MATTPSAVAAAVSTPTVVLAEPAREPARGTGPEPAREPSSAASSAFRGSGASQSVLVLQRKPTGARALVVLADLGMLAVGAWLLSAAFASPSPEAAASGATINASPEPLITPIPTPTVTPADDNSPTGGAAVAPVSIEGRSSALPSTPTPQNTEVATKPELAVADTTVATPVAGTASSESSDAKSSPTKPSPTKPSETKASPTKPPGTVATAPLDPYHADPPLPIADSGPAPDMTVPPTISEAEQQLAKAVSSQSRRSQASFDRCHSQTSKSLPPEQPLYGDMTVAFSVAPSGRVEDAHITRDGTGSSELGRCVLSVVSSWVFTIPASSGDGAGKPAGPVNFVRTFRFS